MECSVRPQALHAFANDLGHADRGAAATVAFGEHQIKLGEALGLKHGDVHNGRATFWITKSGRSRTVPLTDRAVCALADQGRQPGGPFHGVAYQKFLYHWNAVKRDMGLKDDPQFVPHMLRHTCASRLVQAGIDLRRVQTFLGHQTIQMTLRYAHLATDDLCWAGDPCGCELRA